MTAFAGTPVRGALYRARRPPPASGRGEGDTAPWSLVPSGPALKLIEIGNRAQPKNPFSPLLLQCNEPANFRHPVLIDLPGRPEQRFRGRHLTDPRPRTSAAARRPSSLPLPSG